MRQNPPPPSHPGYKNRPAHQVLPQDIQCVYEAVNGCGAIYIGNLEAAQNIQTMQRLRIGSLLTACKNIHIKHPKEHVPYLLYIPGQDHKNYDLSVHFDTAADFIHQSRKQTNILVHCMAGISRSATLVIAYLMKYMGMSMQQAFTAVSTKRRKINPNSGFMQQLQRYQQRLSKNNSDSYQYQSIDRENRPMTSVSGNYLRRASSQKYGEHSHNYNQYYDQGSRNEGKYDKYYSREKSQYITKKYSPEQYITKKYNPEYQPSLGLSLNYSYMQKLYNTPQKQMFGQSRHNRSVQPLSSTINYDTPQACANVQDLSKDLDQRINKIKQKYYQRGNVNLQDNRLDYGKVDRTHDFDLSRHHRAFDGRQAMRNSLYNHKARPVTYNYASYL